MNYKIREIEKKDNAAVENIIRSCLIEYGANHEGTAWADSTLGCFFELYSKKGRKYFVAQDENGELVACCGIGEIKGNKDVCELQKMYALPIARGTGVAEKLLSASLDFAKKHYKQCYLETLDNMKRAHRFYEKHGFRRTYTCLLDGEHFACNVWYLKDL